MTKAPDFFSSSFERAAAPVSPFWTLRDLAPIIHENDASEVEDFSFATREALMDIAQDQADALDVVWAALAQDLNVERPSRMAPFTAGDLKEIFLAHSEHMGFIQTQIPLVVEAGTASFANDTDAFPHCDYAPLMGPFDDETSAIADISNQFQNMSFLRTIGNDVSMISLPVINIDGWILRSLDQGGQRPALRAFQRLVSRVCHDYYHQLTPVNDQVYFGESLLGGDRIPEDMIVDHYVLPTRISTSWERGLMGALENLDSTFAPGNPSEPHAFLVHKRVFQILWQNDQFRAEMQRDIDIVIEGVAALERRMTGEGHDLLSFAALTIVGSYLLRAAGGGHELIQYFSEGIDASFNLTGARANDLLGYHAEDDLLAYSPGEIVMWNAFGMANESYGVIHTREMSKLNASSRRRAQYEMHNARAGLGKWPILSR